MDWFLFDRNLRHERVKTPKVILLLTVSRAKEFDLYLFCTEFFILQLNKISG